MSSNLELKSSFLRLKVENEKELLARFRKNVVETMVKEDEKEEELKKVTLAKKIQTCIKKFDCVCCVKLRAIIYSIYNVVQSNLGLLVLLVLYAGLGAMMFSYLEGAEERRLRGDLVKERRTLLISIEELSTAKDLNRVNHRLKEYLSGIKNWVNVSEEWKENNRTFEEDEEKWILKRSQFSKAVSLLLGDYEDYLKTLPAQILLYGAESPMKEWSFFQSLFFCATVVTTIGYGSVNPVTTNGRLATMIYGVIGIPLCLMFLSRMGKILTRAIKFLWSFIRRFYYTGNCRKVRRLVPLDRVTTQVLDKAKDVGSEMFDKAKDVGSEMFGKINDLATRGSVCRELDEHQSGVYTKRGSSEKIDLLKKLNEEVDGKKKEEDEEEMRHYEVDDTFNLPPIIALAIGIVYIFLGALMYKQWENWSYMEAFYFTFISLSTIGFGDVIPNHPKFFLASFIYLLCGLSLIAMIINVVMEAVDATIRKASSVLNFRKRTKSMAPISERSNHLKRRISV